MKLHTLHLIALASLAALLSPLPGQARDIAWGNSVFDELYDSQGNALDSSFQFEIGTFINGFVPTGSNLSDWITNWIIFDRAPLNTDEIYLGSGPANFFANTATHQTDAESSSLYTTPGATFPQNTQAYLWVYDSKSVSATSEWALVTDFISAGNTGDAWRFPNPADDISPSLTWSLDDAETALFGAVQNGNSRGDGEFSVAPPSFSLQTHQVPEPGGALLIASAGVLFLLRRFRLVALSH
jgi:hypothetical protein